MAMECNPLGTGNTLVCGLKLKLAIHIIMNVYKKFDFLEIVRFGRHEQITGLSHHNYPFTRVDEGTFTIYKIMVL